MKSKTIFIWLTIVVALGILLFFMKNGKSTFSSKDKVEAFEKGARFNKIRIQSGDEAFTIDKSDNKWLVDGGSEASTNKIAAMVAALENIQMNYPASREQTPALIDSVENKGITIDFINGGRNVYHLSFFDMGNETVALSPGKTPVFIGIKAVPDVTLGMIVHKEKTLWYKDLLIDINEKDIADIQIKYPQHQEDNFEIDASKGNIALKSDGKVFEDGVDLENLGDYMRFFRGIHYGPKDTANYTANYSNLLFTLSLEAKTGRVFLLKGYPLYDKDNKIKDINIFSGIVNNSDTIYLKYSEIDPILVRLRYFLKK